MIAGVVSYMLLCLGGGWFAGLVSLTLFSKPEDGRHRPKRVVFFHC